MPIFIVGLLIGLVMGFAAGFSPKPSIEREFRYYMINGDYVEGSDSVWSNGELIWERLGLISK
jgi:hypothetical protein